MYKIIAQVALRAVQQVHIAEDARHAQLILVLQVGSVTPLQHQNRDVVFPAARKSVTSNSLVEWETWL